MPCSTRPFLAWTWTVATVITASWDPTLPGSWDGGLAAEQVGDSEERTKHYHVRCSPGKPSAAEIGTLLEAAWGEYRSFLGKQPKVAKKEPLRVRVYANKSAWQAGIRLEGFEPPAALDYVWFHPQTNAVYTYRQPSAAGTRRYLLYGAWQQFHANVKSKNRDLADSWFVRGLGEHFGFHHWDGDRLEVGIIPLFVHHDLMADALARIEAIPGGLEEIPLDVLRTYSVQYCMVRYLVQGPDREYTRRFHRLALGERGSKLTGPEFAQALGNPRRLAEDFYHWLLKNQMAWTSHSGLWEQDGSRGVRGRPVGSQVGLLVLRADGRTLQARLHLDRGAGEDAGLVLDFVDPEHFLQARIFDGEIIVEQVEGGQASPRAQFLVPRGKEGVFELSARRAGEAVALSVDGERVGEFDSSRGPMGLVVHAGAPRFSHLDWD